MLTASRFGSAIISCGVAKLNGKLYFFAKASRRSGCTSATATTCACGMGIDTDAMLVSNRRTADDADFDLSHELSSYPLMPLWVNNTKE